MAKPSGILALIGGGKPKPGESEMSGEPGGDMGGSAKEMAAADMMSALKSDDASAFADAFQRMHDACGMMGGGEEEPEGPEYGA